jgi:hypothetical protein
LIFCQKFAVSAFPSHVMFLNIIFLFYVLVETSLSLSDNKLVVHPISTFIKFKFIGELVYLQQDRSLCGEVRKYFTNKRRFQ